MISDRDHNRRTVRTVLTVTGLIALLAGGAMWEPVGAVLAIPTAAIFSVIVSELIADAAT